MIRRRSSASKRSLKREAQRWREENSKATASMPSCNATGCSRVSFAIDRDQTPPIRHRRAAAKNKSRQKYAMLRPQAATASQIASDSMPATLAPAGIATQAGRPAIARFAHNS